MLIRAIIALYALVVLYAPAAFSAISSASIAEGGFTLTGASFGSNHLVKYSNTGANTLNTYEAFYRIGVVE